MRNKFIWITIVVLVIGGLGVYLYKRSSNSISYTDEVRIGVILPLSGDLAFLGESGKNGVLLAEYYINSIQKGRKLKVILEDGKGQPSVSISAANKLITSDEYKNNSVYLECVDLLIQQVQEREKFIFIKLTPLIRN